MTSRVLFIDGHLAGQTAEVQANIYTIKSIDTSGSRFPEDGDIHLQMTEVTYWPVGRASRGHDPQPWTCRQPPQNEAEYHRALATAWCLMHSPEGERP